ncbi:MAG: riboflavin synthase [Bacteroidetes bacterium]|nr:riboflavin synthase [Bacteroidota bacterium]
MFTGIIEEVGEVIAINTSKTNTVFTIKSSFTADLQINQSVAHNGVCLSVTAKENNTYQVTAIQETLQKTNLSAVKIGDKVNLERCLSASARFDGHIVQGHVDATATCVSIKDMDGSWVFEFKHAVKPEFITVEKGSVAVNGISLTVVNSKKDRFSIAVIPYTFQHTNLHKLQVGEDVNIEFDVVGKYMAKLSAGYLPNL